GAGATDSRVPGRVVDVQLPPGARGGGRARGPDRAGAVPPVPAAGQGGGVRPVAPDGTLGTGPSPIGRGRAGGDAAGCVRGWSGSGCGGDPPDLPQARP